jgi:hypothetical protein
MIADFVNFAIAGIDFCHAASRLILRRALRGGMNTVMTQSWTRPQPHYRGLKSSVSARDCI